MGKKVVAIGVDIGGINSAIGIIDQTGALLKESGISTKAYPYYEDYPAYIAALSSAIKEALASLEGDYEVAGIGIGAPNANYRKGRIERPANLWKANIDKDGTAREPAEGWCFELCHDLGEYFPELKHIILTNDADAATIGELMFGAGKGCSDFVMVTLGTGLGSGFVANGELITGHDGFAGELGHSIVVNGGRECGCGKRGCLECYVSATGIKRTAFEMMATLRGESPLRNISYNDFDSAMISKAAAAGDRVALETFRVTGEVLGCALANVVTICSPEKFVIFGGLAKAGELLFAPTRESFEANLTPIYKGKIKIEPSAITNRNIAILGAASLVWRAIDK